MEINNNTKKKIVILKWTTNLIVIFATIPYKNDKNKPTHIYKMYNVTNVHVIDTHLIHLIYTSDTSNIPWYTLIYYRYTWYLLCFIGTLNKFDTLDKMDTHWYEGHINWFIDNFSHMFMKEKGKENPKPCIWCLGTLVNGSLYCSKLDVIKTLNKTISFLEKCFN